MIILEHFWSDRFLWKYPTIKFYAIFLKVYLFLIFFSNICCKNVAVSPKILLLLLQFVFHFFVDKNQKTKPYSFYVKLELAELNVYKEKIRQIWVHFCPPPWRNFLDDRGPAGGDTKVYRFLISINVVSHDDYWGRRNILSYLFFSLKVRKNAKIVDFCPTPP